MIRIESRDDWIEVSNCGTVIFEGHSLTGNDLHDLLLRLGIDVDFDLLDEDEPLSWQKNWDN